MTMFHSEPDYKWNGRHYAPDSWEEGSTFAYEASINVVTDEAVFLLKMLQWSIKSHKSWRGPDLLRIAVICEDQEVAVIVRLFRVARKLARRVGL